MTPDLRLQALAWRAAQRPAVVVEVAGTRGSVPREAGTRMLVAAGEVLGTIGGGHLELKAIEAAQRLLARVDEPRQPPEPHELHFALGPSLGQCCGGAVTLRLTPLAADDPARWDTTPPRFRLQLYGAGHVGRAIVRLLEGLPCRVQWIDERAREFPAEPSAPHIERICVDAVEAEVAQAPPGACYLVLTHSHDLDMAITEAVLKRGDFAWLGLIGSATKRARFLRRFEARGIAPAVLARMTCPIGVPGITGKEPEVIAVAAVAQLLQAASAAA
ncbi:MAG: xanthine dehydrogenase accessory protein XdhC [Rubrivivax sp.]|nr:xanthine dehydrogenase accessory protein XdhC [Rubrivivax sp.]